MEQSSLLGTSEAIQEMLPNREYSYKETKDIPYYLGDDRHSHKHCLNIYIPETEGIQIH